MISIVLQRKIKEETKMDGKRDRPPGKLEKKSKNKWKPEIQVVDII